jgi:hypothetical protein
MAEAGAMRMEQVVHQVVHQELLRAMVLSHLMPVELAEKIIFAVQVTGAVVVVVVLVVQARPL